MSWNINWTAHVAAHRVVTVPPARSARPVAKKVVCIERFIANVIVSQTVELRCTALSHDVHAAARAFSTLRLIVIQEHLHFRDAVDIDRRVEIVAAARGGRYAVHIHGTVVTPRAGERRGRT